MWKCEKSVDCNVPHAPSRREPEIIFVKDIKVLLANPGLSIFSASEVG